MKKIVSVLFFVFLISACFADDFKFLGIPFGTSSDEVRSVMESKGWTCSPAKTDGDLCFTGKTYAGKELDDVQMFFVSDKFKTVMINFKEASDGYLVLSTLADKYNLTKKKKELTYYSINKDSFSLFGNCLVIMCGQYEYHSDL